MGGLVDPVFVLNGNPITWGDFTWTGDYTFIDLLAASTNALNGALLARRPDHYKSFTVVGILLMALLEDRPLLGRKLHKKSQRELRDLGLLVEEPAEAQPAGVGS